MRRTSRPLVILGAFACALGIIAAPAVAANRPKDELVIAQGAEVSILDPQMIPNNQGWAVVANVFDTLIGRDRNLQLQPRLALEWKSTGPTTWQVKLRRGVKFHNGETFDASSVKFSLERLVDPAQKMVAIYLFNTIQRVDIVDPYTVTIVTVKPDPVLPARLASIGSQVLPPKYVRDIGNDAFGQRPVGTGPYRFVEWIRDVRLVLEANRGYWGGTPRFSKVTFRPIPESGARVGALLTGEVDIAGELPPHEFPRVEASGEAEVASVLGNEMINFTINAEQKPFTDRRIRQALNYAVDKEAIVKKLFRGITKPLNGPIPPSDFGYNPTLIPYPYDPAKAKALLAEAGYAQGFEFTMIGTQGQYLLDREVTEAVAGYFRDIGLQPRIRYVDSAERRNIIRHHGIDGMFLLNPISMNLDADGSLWRVIQPGGILAYFRHPKVDQLLLDARHNLNSQERLRQYQEASAILRDEAPWVFLYVSPWTYGVRKHLRFQPRADNVNYLDEIEIR